MLWQSADRPVPGGRPRAVAVGSHPDEAPSRGDLDHAKGLPTTRRPSRQRVAVEALLRRVEDFCSAQQIHGMLRDQGDRVGLTTVYRSLRAGARSGDLDVIVRSDGEALYRLRRPAQGNRHHLVCRRCGLTVEVEDHVLEEWTASVAHANRFSDVRPSIDIFGVCEGCTGSATSQAESPE